MEGHRAASPSTRGRPAMAFVKAVLKVPSSRLTETIIWSSLEMLNVIDNVFKLALRVDVREMTACPLSFTTADRPAVRHLAPQGSQLASM